MSNPILDAKTVAELMTALDEAYPDLELPRSFPKGTALGDLWEEPIEVTPLAAQKILYQAKGKQFARIPLPIKERWVSVEVEDPNPPPQEEE